MSGSIFGNKFTCTTWGESHGKGVGVVIDGVPAGLSLCEEDIQRYLNRRKPGSTSFSTPRQEADEVQILSGVFEGFTTGTPISLFVPNTSQNSQDYSKIAAYYRPGHADYTFDKKYGFHDYRGGGRSSGRETIGRVAAGAVAMKILKELGIEICAYTKSIGPINIDMNHFNQETILQTPTAMPDIEADKKACLYLNECMAQSDSAGGVIECIVSNMPVGIGEPVFHKLDALLSFAIMSIGAVKAFEIGDGILVATAKGSTNNDSFCNDNGTISKRTNHSGGILGGISDGAPIILRAYIKPTPSIFSTQQTVTKNGEPIDINVKGRHDPIIVPRAVVVVEAMTAITIVDLLFQNTTSTMTQIKKIYK